ncbi:MAG: permease-like cell division protein FtsX [Thermoanaerobaculia bacterium]|nr:permease-like cell division protein FtsX [Thermoanaerobaculia bacterium]
MTLLQALAFFLREALVSIRRSFKISLLAVVTIAVSLFVGGIFLLLTRNLNRIVMEWRGEARVVVYLAQDAPEGEAERLAGEIRRLAWVSEVEEITSGEAERRFTEAFPSLGGLFSDWEGPTLPSSLEVAYDAEAVDPRELSAWQGELARDPAVALVDDDREWLRQIERLVALLRGIGLLLGAVLLSAAVFTIASVVRLTVYLYREEIAVLRLVGATEFFIRGPFLVEGLLQGLLGSLLAAAGLFLSFRLIASQALPSIFGSVLFDRFLSPGDLLLVGVVGSLAGLLGSILSLRRDDGSLFN